MYCLCVCLQVKTTKSESVVALGMILCVCVQCCWLWACRILLSLERNYRDDFQGSTFRGASADLPRTSPSILKTLEPVMIIMITTRLKCYSSYPHDFSHEDVDGRGKNLIRISLVVMLMRSMLLTRMTLNLAGISQN